MEERNKEEQEPHETPADDADTGASDSSPAADTLPSAPAEDESALGDTDQHSDA
ncbi:MAG: hypothetical protein M3065_09915 [Actinomycetota bacterium]|nr:hypothetical protein [Actinomycetota bacterium]